jgi:hypothetical protein
MPADRFKLANTLTQVLDLEDPEHFEINSKILRHKAMFDNSIYATDASHMERSRRADEHRCSNYAVISTLSG